MGLHQMRSSPVHARVCPTHANKIPEITSKTTTSTISTCSPKLWKMNTICKTNQQCPTPQQTKNKVHPGSDRNIIILCTSGQGHNVDGTKCHHNGTSYTNDHNNEKYKTVSGLCCHKQQSDDHIKGKQHGLSHSPQCLLFKQVTNKKQGRGVFFHVKQHNSSSKQWHNPQHSTGHQSSDVIHCRS